MSKEEKLSSRPRFSRRTKLAIAIGGLLSVGVIGIYSGTASHWVAKGLHGVDNPGKDIYTLAQKTLGSYEDGTPEADVTGDMPGDSPLPEWVEQDLPGAPDMDAPEASVTEHTAPPDPLSFLPTALASSDSIDSDSDSNNPQEAPESASAGPTQGNALPLSEATHTQELELAAHPADVTAPSDQSDSISTPELAQSDDVMRALSMRIGQHLQIPLENQVSEAVKVQIRINDAGELLDTQLLQSSGDSDYDHSVLEAALVAAPYYEITELSGPDRDRYKELIYTREFNPVTKNPQGISGFMVSLDRTEIAQTDITSSEAFQRMVRAIGVRVGQHWRIPVEDPYSEASMVRIRITDTGDLLEAKIVQSSGNAEYDRSVLEAAQAAAPYYEVTELTGPARDMLKEFKLTFGAVDRLPPQQNTVDPSVPPGPRFVTTPEEADDDMASDNPVSSDYLAGVVSRIEQAWVRPSEVSVRNDATVQVKLAVPFGTVMSADLIRTSGDDAFDESIASAVRHAGPFEGIQKLSIKEQQALQSFRLHFSQTGIYP